MGASTGIMLTATAISFGNEWIQTDQLNFRIGAAGLAGALILDGVEKISEPAATGLATILLITVLLTPFNGKSPVESLSDAISGKQVKAQTPAGNAVITVKPGSRTVIKGIGAQ